MRPPRNPRPDSDVDENRRKILRAAGTGVVGTFFGGIFPATQAAGEADVTAFRWGIVGTGYIANSMAPMIRQAPLARLAAVSSRRLETANEFGEEHAVPHRFDDWSAMLASDEIDAVYIATPTAVREKIAVAAAANGKHVLAEKPFASLASLKRMTAACRDRGVGFMDGTHFVHAPRTRTVRERTRELVGWPWSLDSAFQFNLPDRENIRYDSRLEPMGAIGDAGWYNMRAIVEYLSPDVELLRSDAYLRRDEQTGAAISGSGVMAFSDGSTSTWNCGFDSAITVMDLRLSGEKGVLWMDDFVLARSAGDPGFRWATGGRDVETIVVPEDLPAAARMFENFAGMAGDADWRQRSMHASERTQALLDEAWAAALAAESVDDAARD
jgi:predicted dehydrogenase